MKFYGERMKQLTEKQWRSQGTVILVGGSDKPPIGTLKMEFMLKPEYNIQLKSFTVTFFAVFKYTLNVILIMNCILTLHSCIGRYIEAHTYKQLDS